MKKHLSTIFLVLILIVGLSLLLYPTFANYWNSFTQSRVVAGYIEQLAVMDDDQYQQIWNDAKLYNASLLHRVNNFILSDEQREEYNALLNVGGNEVMGYIEIPSINVSLPIYHGTDEGVLAVGVGHLEWTSLPVGGESTHCVLSGHRGLPSARLFTDLDQLKEGDYFMLNILDETLTYEVDQIRIVEPEEVDKLTIIEGRDLCTLVTCTPYGVNSHRLLVRGHRVDNLEEAVTVRVTADAVEVEPLIVASILLVPTLVLFLSVVLAVDRFRKLRK